MTAEESYSLTPPIDMPACDLMMQIINREQNQSREIAPHNMIQLTPEQEKQIKSGNNHQLIHQVTLIDDFCISTSKLPNITSEQEQLKKQLNVHLLCLKQLLMTTIECSRQPENSTRPFQPVKYKNEKNHLFKRSVKFLNFIYIGNHQIIDLDAFKGATNLDTLPTTGETLASRISFFTYFMAYIPNLRYLCKDLEAFALRFPNNKLLNWDEHPDLAKKYQNLATVSRALSGITVLPNDINKVNFLVLSSDACNKTMAYSVGVSLLPDPDTKDTETNTNQTQKQAKLQLVRNYSCNLEPHLRHMPIASKECMSAVKALTMEEPLLKLMRSKKIYHTIDNSVLFGLLEQLQNSKELANHFLAHTAFRDWVLRLHQLTTLYNVTVLLVPSKLCMADVCTRGNDPTKRKKVKGTDGQEKDNETGTETPEPKSNCKICTICNIACQNTSAHSNCPYNIQNSDILSQHGPQLLNYKDSTEHKIINEGKEIRYITASTTFDPTKYKILQLDQVVAALNYSQQETLDQSQAASAEKTIDEEIQRLDLIKESEILAELQHIDEARLATAEPPPQADDPKPEIKSITASPSQLTETRSKNYNFLQVMPNKMFQINLYGKHRLQPTRDRPEKSTILIFTGIRKSMRIASSLYANQLVGSRTEKLERRPNGVTYTENPGELSYLISCTPQDRLGQNTSSSPENFLPQLYEAIRQASIKSPHKDLIIDGNSIQKFYALNTETIMTALIYVSRPYRKHFLSIGLITWHRNQDPKTEDDQCDQLVIALPVFKNGIKQATLRLKLDKKGRCPTLIQQIKEYNKIGYQTRIEIEFRDKTIEEYHRTNLTTAKAIHLKRHVYSRTVTDEPHPEATQYTMQEDPSDEPIIDALMAQRKLRIHQANDPYLMPILSQLQQAADNHKILQSDDGSVQLKWKNNVVYGKASHIHDESAWRPVLPEAMIIPEILAAHMTQRCSSAHNAIEQIKKIFFHKKNVTSHYDLETMSQKILPCPRCIIRRPHSIAGNKLYTESKSIVMSLKGLPCATIAHDIIYIAKPQSQEFANKYLSIIVCYGCGYTHLKLLDRITGHNIATHVLDMIQITGNIPHVMITDSATTELRGVMAQCIQSLNIIQLKTNQKILEKTREKSPIHYTRPRPPESNIENYDISTDPSEFPTVLLEDLSEEQRNMLLQDFAESAPPLYSPILSHNPVPYIDQQSYRSTSLGRLDSICKQIGIFLRKFITTQPQLLQDENIDYLIQSFAFYHNFLHDDIRTKQPPAKLHLGALRFFNTHTLMRRLHNQTNISDPEPMKKLQMMLQTAQEHREAQINRNNHDQLKQQQHSKAHGRLRDEKEIQETLPLLSIIMMNTEMDHTKTSKKPNLHGPNLVIAKVPDKRTVYLYNLIEGHIYKRSFRAIQKLLPSQEILSTPNVLDWFHFHPLQIISRLSNTESTQPELTTDQYVTVLKNLTKVYDLLKPVLPTAAETQKMITLGDSPPDEGHIPIENQIENAPPDTPISNQANKKMSVQFRDEDTTEIIKDISKTKKKHIMAKDTANNEDSTHKSAYEHQGAQGVDVAATPDPTIPTPPIPDGTRNPGRPKRARVIPSRYR